MHDGLGIVEFFSGKKLLITGATGFLAKGTLHYYIKLSLLHKTSNNFTVRNLFIILTLFHMYSSCREDFEDHARGG